MKDEGGGKKKKGNSEKTAIYVADINPTMSVWLLNVNGLKTPINK